MYVQIPTRFLLYQNPYQSKNKNLTVRAHPFVWTAHMNAEVHTKNPYHRMKSDCVHVPMKNPYEKEKCPRCPQVHTRAHFGDTCPVQNYVRTKIDSVILFRPYEPFECLWKIPMMFAFRTYTVWKISMKNPYVRMKFSMVTREENNL